MDNKKWTKKYLVLIWLITLIVVVASIWGHMINWGGFRVLSNSWPAGKNVELKTYDFSNEKLTDVTIDMNEADINIKYGDKLSVDASFPEKYEPKVELKGGKLIIYQRDNVKHISDSDGFKVDIMIPNNAALDNVKIDVAAGDIDIKDVKADNLDINANAGDIDIKDITAGKIDIDANAGDIDVSNVTGDKVDIDANAGDINLMESTVKSAEVNANAGDIDITGNYDQIDCECDFGDVDINAPNTDRNKINADCSFGSVNIKARN